MTIKSKLATSVIFAVLVVFAYSGVMLYQSTTNPEAPLNPFSSVALEKEYLRGYSNCSTAVLSPQIENGLSPTRSDLYYTEMRCKLAEKARFN